MTSGSLLTVLLPLALGVIMLGLGLSLTLDDFRRVARQPGPILVALLCQTVLLPLLCFALVKAFGLAPALAVGLMLLAASPGGTTANLYSHLAHGDVALNISLTAVNSVLAVVTLPLLVNLSLQYFMGDSHVLPLQFDKVMQVFAIVLVPVAIGMAVRARRSAFAQRMTRPVRIASVVVLVAIIAVAVARDWTTLVTYAPVIGMAALAFNVASLLVGYWVPRLIGMDKRQAIAIGMEIGIHNGTLAIAVALSPSLLDNPTMAIPAAIYSLIMFFTAAVFGWLVSRDRARGVASP
ncbi:bile acid:sodium symporter family protein [Lysobacter arenosi]|uniref:Bile acid:sodium symporter family protein n=1 Tax=Lysobacter arenosi TaxID=2795387 RepID=A0ABX7RAM1_9GAMM|nr:bile acid:sodium symporter family protein [Lysobacter arenosi]QSX74037.1 bile acid:sodium symporter family protein [Lysobacter arenosi]